MLKLKGKFGLVTSGAVASLVLAACSGNGVGVVSTSAPLQLKESNGATSGATCLATGWGGSPTYGTGTSDSDGVVNLTLVFDSGIPEDAAILVTCTGGTYFDEATGLETPIPAGTTTTTVVSSNTIAGGSAAVAVSPLTSIAVDLLESAGGVPTGDSANTANAEVAAVFGLSSITSEPETVNSATPDYGSGSDSLYALALAAFSEAAAALGETPAEFAASITAGLKSGNTAAVSLAQSELATALNVYSANLAAAGDVIPASIVASLATAIINGAKSAPITPGTGSS